MSEPETNIKEVNKESQSTPNVQKDESDDKNRDAYFIILRPSEQKINLTGLNYETENKIKPSIIFNKTIDKENKTFLEEIVFKFKKKSKKKGKDKDKKESTKSTKYAIKFIEEEHTYNITFQLKDDCFVYQPQLKTGNKYLPNILEEPIQQNIVPLYNKLDIFLEALEKAKETDKKEEKLYEDSIDLYERKKEFGLLISLFLKIYEKNEVLCSRLIEIFYRINDQENNDKVVDLNKFVKSFKDIYSNASNILKKNKYKPIYFYGILFCYLHYYDKTNFPKMIEEFSEENADNLYEILIQYNSHFMNPLKQSQKFYNGFIRYALKKDKQLKLFKRILNYVEDIETYLFVINSNIKQIFDKYEELKSAPIKISSSLTLVKYKVDNRKKVDTNDNKKKDNENSDDESDISDEDNTKGLDKIKNIENECDTIIQLIKAMIAFSKKEIILAIYLKSTFWINLIQEYNFPDWENISNCHKLRELYKEYNNLINFLYEQEDIKSFEHKKEKDNIYYNIKSDITRYYLRDEIALILNDNIKKFFEKNNKISNAEILGTVENYNPYFSVRDIADKEKYKNNRETYIFDYINYSQITEYFIQNFQKLNFETMFEENITDYINKITGKIKDIKSFGNVIKLITVERINEEKKREYFRILEEKYNFIIKDSIKSIKNKQELKEAIKIIAEFVSKIFLYENNNRFLEKEISSLEENIKSLIYIELITTYNEEEYKLQKNRIYEIYLEKIDTKEGRDNFIKLVRNLKGEDKKYFIYEKFLEKCIFKKEEFFSNHENYKIQTLCLLNKELSKDSQEEDTKKEDKANKGKDNKKEVKLNILELSQQGNKHAENLVNLLDSIREDLDKGIIIKKDLEKFLNIKSKKNEQKIEADVTKKGEEKSEENKNASNQTNDKSDPYVNDKLELITLILENYDPKTKYYSYKSNIERINESVVKLKFIKDSLMIFHRNLYNEDIRAITIILNAIENNPIQQFRAEETRKSIEVLLKHIPLCDEIKKVKDFLLFKKIFENAQGVDQAERFADANVKLQELKKLFSKKSSDIEVIFNHKDYVNTFKDIKEELGKKEEFKSKLFIQQMIDYFDIKDKKVIKEINMILIVKNMK